MERFIHSCWLKTPPTQAPISLGSQIFRNKFKIGRVSQSQPSATGSWICARKASKAKFLNRMFDSRSSMKNVEPSSRGPIWKGKPLDLALQIRYYAAQAVYKRPAGHVKASSTVDALSRTAQWLFYESKWPSHKSAMAVLSRPMAVLSRPMAVLSRGALAASRPG